MATLLDVHVDLCGRRTVGVFWVLFREIVLMMYSTEYATVRGDDRPRSYLGVVSNAVEVVPYNVRSTTYHVHIVVPSVLFVLFRTVLKYRRSELLERPIQFYLMETMNGDWVFGFDQGPDDDRGRVDLWPYRKKRPAWAAYSRRV